jgi:hypothetical protein
MSDVELLDLAAKAVGYKLHIWGLKGAENVARIDTEPPTRWNPLEDDGDALRLAVKLNISPFSLPGGKFVRAAENLSALARGVQYGNFADELKATDPYAATRRAIVRAAAEIGKSA